MYVLINCNNLTSGKEIYPVLLSRFFGKLPQIIPLKLITTKIKPTLEMRGILFSVKGAILLLGVLVMLELLFSLDFFVFIFGIQYCQASENISVHTASTS